MAHEKYPVNNGTLLQAIQAAKLSVAVVMNICNQSHIPEDEHDADISEVFSQTSAMVTRLSMLEDKADWKVQQELKANMKLIQEMFGEAGEQE